MRIGMLTGGGDCPGLNAVIRAATRRLVDGGAEPVGVLRGWRGMIEGLLPPARPRGGLGHPPARRHDPPHEPHQPVHESRAASRRCARPFERLDGLIAIGGEDTLGVAARLHAEHGLPVIGVPKTIDNDIAGTDQTFGFDTAVSIATEAIDRLHTTAESHDRVMVVEVMGRHAGWLAVRERHRGRRRRRADPRVPAHRRALRRADPPAAWPRQGLLDRRRERGLAVDARGGRGRARDDDRRASMHSGTCASAASASGSRTPSSRSPDSRRA